MLAGIKNIYNTFIFNALSRALKASAWDNSEGWCEERGQKEFQDGGTHVYPWLIHVDAWQKPPQYLK